MQCPACHSNQVYRSRRRQSLNEPSGGYSRDLLPMPQLSMATGTIATELEGDRSALALSGGLRRGRCSGVRDHRWSHSTDAAVLRFSSAVGEMMEYGTAWVASSYRRHPSQGGRRTSNGSQPCNRGTTAFRGIASCAIKYCFGNAAVGAQGGLAIAELFSGNDPFRRVLRLRK